MLLWAERPADVSCREDRPHSPGETATASILYHAIGTRYFRTWVRFSRRHLSRPRDQQPVKVIAMMHRKGYQFRDVRRQNGRTGHTVPSRIRESTSSTGASNVSF